MKAYLFALNAWNHMPHQARVSLLASLSHPTTLSARAYPFVPSWVRQDIQRRLLSQIQLAGHQARQYSQQPTRAY